ncbi:MAG: hemerythrin domain-containing protein [Hydrogenothermaceae bacterium]
MIKVIELTEDLLTGVSEMDKEHQMLVDMLNTVYDLLAEGKREAAKEYFESEIVHYVEYHLSDEEKFMETICYP